MFATMQAGIRCQPRSRVPGRPGVVVQKRGKQDTPVGLIQQSREGGLALIGF